jgi:hypothetical protein
MFQASVITLIALMLEAASTSETSLNFFEDIVQYLCQYHFYIEAQNLYNFILIKNCFSVRPGKYRIRDDAPNLVPFYDMLFGTSMAYLMGR